MLSPKHVKRKRQASVRGHSMSARWKFQTQDVSYLLERHVSLGHMRLDQVDRCGEYKWTSKSRQEMEKAKVEVEEKAEEVEIANAEYEKSAFSSKRRRRP